MPCLSLSHLGALSYPVLGGIQQLLGSDSHLGAGLVCRHALLDQVCLVRQLSTHTAAAAASSI